MEGQPQTQPGKKSREEELSERLEALEQKVSRREQIDEWMIKIQTLQLKEAEKFLKDREYEMIVTFENGIDQRSNGEEPFGMKDGYEGCVYVHAVTDDNGVLIVGCRGHHGVFLPYYTTYR